MTVCPAQAAGVKEIVVVMPPTPNGAYNRDLLAVCHELGVTEVYRVGGAQAVAALAYGVDGIAAGGHDRRARATCSSPWPRSTSSGRWPSTASPGRARSWSPPTSRPSPDFVAVDLIAQAEHSPGVSRPGDLARRLLGRGGAVARTSSSTTSPRRPGPRQPGASSARSCWPRTRPRASRCVNELAPEHLHVQTRDPEAFAEQVDNAGAIFLGPFTPVALGDYAAGPSHVLPTGGTARFASGLIGERLPQADERHAVHPQRACARSPTT